MLKSPYHSFSAQSRTTEQTAVTTKPKQVFHCQYCQKVFKRSEHCARHELAHTKERPFPCQFCLKTYARKDLVKRHEKTIHAEEHYRLLAASASKCRVDNTEQAKDAAAPAISGRDSGASQWLANSSQKPFTSRRATFSDGAIRPSTNPQTVRQPSVSSFPTMADPSTPSTRALKSPERIPHTQLSIDGAQIGGPLSQSQPQSPVAEPQRLDVDVNELLLPMQFDRPLDALPQNLSLDAGKSTEHFDTEQSRTKRPRLTVDASELQSIQDDIRFPPLAETSLAADDTFSLFHSFDFMENDLVFGTVSGDFFFDQISQQQDRASPDLASMSNVLEMSNSLSFPAAEPMDKSAGSQTTNEVGGTGTAKSDRSAVRLPMILKENSKNPPKLTVDDATFQKICSDAYQRLGNDRQIPIRSCREMQHFLTGYLDCFHQHLPIIHFPSLVLWDTPSPLIFAMCAVGAMYRLDQQRAQKIYALTDEILEAEIWKYTRPVPAKPQHNPSLGGKELSPASKMKPLWVMQSRILLSLFASLGADSALIQSELDRLGIFTTDYRSRRTAIQTKSNRNAEASWEDWVDLESTKRLLCAIFIYSNLLVVTFDISPGFGVTQDLEVELLEEEKLWNASTAEEWRTLQNSRISMSTRTIRSVMIDMLTGATNECANSKPYYVSGFTALVIIHAVNLLAWNLSQSSELLTCHSSNLSGTTSNSLLSSTLTTLSRCREVLRHARPDTIESLWNNPEGPLLLNCEAMLRVAYTRLFFSANMPERLILLCNSPQENIRLLTAFVATKQERHPLITKAMVSMCEAFSVPSQAGYLLVRKTAAISWSVEHALAGWGCVLPLSKWVHCLEIQSSDFPPTDSENEIIQQVKAALEGMDSGYDGDSSLAAAIVESWAPLMSDVWVWGITKKMGRILMDLAQVYETDFAARKIHRGG